MERQGIVVSAAFRLMVSKGFGANLCIGALFILPLKAIFTAGWDMC